MKLTLDHIGPWIEIIREKAEAEKIDVRTAAAQIKQDLQYYQQLGGIERQIQKANQELGLINMTAIRKQQVLRVVEGLFLLLDLVLPRSFIINISI